MFDSPESASLWFDIFNGILLTGAFLVLIGTWGTIKTAGVKERFSDERIASNEAEAKRAVAESDLAKEGAAKANERSAALEVEAGKARAAIAEADARAAQAAQKASEADERAAEANKIAEGERLVRLKLEAEMAWRKFTDRQLEEFVASLTSFAGRKFDLITYQDDPECLSLANQIGQALIKAGWVLEKPKSFLMFPIVVGVDIIVASSKEAELAPAANALREALDKAGFAGGASLEKAYDTDAPDVIRLKIGKKPERISR